MLINCSIFLTASRTSWNSTFPYTTLFRSPPCRRRGRGTVDVRSGRLHACQQPGNGDADGEGRQGGLTGREGDRGLLDVDLWRGAVSLHRLWTGGAGTARSKAAAFRKVGAGLPGLRPGSDATPHRRIQAAEPHLGVRGDQAKPGGNRAGDGKVLRDSGR